MEETLASSLIVTCFLIVLSRLLAFMGLLSSSLLTGADAESFFLSLTRVFFLPRIGVVGVKISSSIGVTLPVSNGLVLLPRFLRLLLVGVKPKFYSDLRGLICLNRFWRFLSTSKSSSLEITDE